MLADKEFYKNIIDNMIPLHQVLGITLLDIEDGYAKLSLPFKPEIVGDPRMMAVHGGVISTAMDAAGGAAAMTTLVSFEDRLSTIDMRVDYLRPAVKSDMIVEGRIVRSGNRIIVTTMTVHLVDSDKPVAEGKGVYNVRRKEND